MALVCDAHVHLYPSYDLPRALHAACRNLDNLAGAIGSTQESHIRVCCLTERSDCRVFQQLARRLLRLDGSGIVIEPTREESSLCTRMPDGSLLFIIAGRQINTTERLELLALGADAEIPDGLTFAEARARALNAGALPVLNWAPGKWLFRRKPIVRELIETAQPENLLLCDTTLRPPLWLTPKLMKLGRSRGLAVLAGSDPLPAVGEELLIGSYGMVSTSSLDHDFPAGSLRDLLLSKPGRFRIAGRRSGNIRAALRVSRQLLSKR